mmetsp:Transcript_21091/g.27334  ORF Transcript_21091/g.27334 Transcript_21091/m.27334 type:complete len:98 (-) Transcript_21091:245-538(-)|eukprot:CAMPEP_0197291012 /NCGR_PEP_ID=MMETSP0890-20130614/10885_1 /TAXON_ID=44058 ORGANISM="Aureoumbra lagunensis, Strain CCMP1510" /NCGR_SAMPLE_ID=MMETSP0890 /ASSEMBLY_ACC=CAM_ASM_000533 /LENGTH=97 /DNA_ID=CAMNT_0042763475 /DNA_START=61 /DNA_END=354 /DNA_ORIENTATION=-
MAAEKQKESASLEKVTDYVEEETIDGDKTKEALSVIESTMSHDAEDRREKEMTVVEIRQEDVDIIENELEVGRDAAVHALRTHGGDLTAALRALINS